MKTTYECDCCHEIFSTAEECQEHEKLCSIRNVPIKLLHINENEIAVIDFPDAKYLKSINNIDRISLIPDSGCERYNKFYPITKFRFDKIMETRYGHKVYTMNLDKNYEKLMIEKLVEYHTNELKENIKEIEKIIDEWNDFLKTRESDKFRIAHYFNSFDGEL